MLCARLEPERPRGVQPRPRPAATPTTRTSPPRRSRHLGREQPDRPGPGHERRRPRSSPTVGRAGSGTRTRAARRGQRHDRPSQSGTRCRLRSGTITCAREGTVDERADRAASGQRLIRPSRHHSHTPHVEKYVSETTRTPSQSGSTPVTHRADHPADLVPHGDGRDARETRPPRCAGLSRRRLLRGRRARPRPTSGSRVSRSAIPTLPGPGASLVSPFTTSSATRWFLRERGGGAIPDHLGREPERGPRARADPDLARVRVVGDEVPVDLDPESRTGRQTRSRCRAQAAGS